MKNYLKVRRISQSRDGHLHYTNPKKCSITVMVSNVNLLKYHYCSDSDVIMCTLVKYYSFDGSFIRPYAHILVRLF